MAKKKSDSTESDIPDGLKQWKLRGFLDHFIRIHEKVKNRSFCFILGAGASKPSGIRTGTELVDVWLPEIRPRFDSKPQGSPTEQWATAENLNIPGFEWDRRAEFYPDIYDRRFEIDPEEGHEFIEREMEGKSPSFGYSVLAQILAGGRHQVVITTNFDNLVADALFLYTHKYPIVCGHERLATFAQPNLRRPLIVKIHRDLLFSPFSSRLDTDQLRKDWESVLKELFRFYTPIVIGYGGNDGSLMGFLKELDPSNMPGGLFWCYREKGKIPARRLLDIIKKLNGVVVPIAGFDELMFILSEEMNLPRLDNLIRKYASDSEKRYTDQAEKLAEQIGKSATEEGAEDGIKETLDSVKEFAEKQTDWWRWELKARAESDLDKREAIYRAGVKKTKDHPYLLGNFANFMFKTRKHYDEAERLYKRALELDPDKALNTGNFATFMCDIRKDYDEAEQLYKKALELDLDDATNTANFATFMTEIRTDHDEAERLYKRALELDPNDAKISGNFAVFMKNIRENYDEAERLYKRALELDPNNAINTGNFANFMKNIRKNYGEAERLYKKALELDPDNAPHTGNFASLLLAQGRVTDARDMSSHAWTLNNGEINQLAAETAVYRGLIRLLENKNDNLAMSRLKTIISTGFERETWSFDDVLAYAKDHISPENFKLYSAIADAINDEEKVKDLDNFPRWKEIDPIPLDEPWLEDE